MVTASPPDRRSLLAQIGHEISECRRCPRLVQWREQVATDKRASLADQEYWGRGVPGFGDPAASVVVVGLAPAAHGANRTGRTFTGDRSGDFLFAALYRAGLASQPQSSGTGDGLRLTGAWITSAVRCAPPANKPTPQERDTCGAYLRRELAALSEARSLLVLGGFAYQALGRIIAYDQRVAFGHGAVNTSGALTVVCSYHPSQQNTFTGRLTPEMLDQVVRLAVESAQSRPSA